MNEIGDVRSSIPLFYWGFSMKWSSHHFIVFLRVFNEIEIITPPAISSLGCSNVDFIYVIANDVIVL